MTVVANERFDVDEPLVGAAREGDRHAFAEFVRRHTSFVRGVVLGVLGTPAELDDVTQEVWVTVWQRFATLKDASRWKSWLYRLARNAAIDAGRRRTRRKKRSRQWQNDGAGDGSAPPAGDAMALHEERRSVWQAIGGLPALYREPFVLRHVCGWSYPQIAETMGMPVDSIETRLVRARRLLREALTEQAVET
jgi:RNA polymerase sigma-70 factor (ECF subfamily)